jgi:hypothetical protein
MGGIARKLQIDHCKWDTQVGDTCVLSSQPFLIAETEWQWLCRKAEQATAELFAFEDEIAASPLLQRTIGIPWQLRDLFHAVGDECGPRTLRFDFHPTATGWLISEVNSDVPGGFNEASALPYLFEAFRGRGAAPANPLHRWGSLVTEEPAIGHIALLHAPGYLEDLQVVLSLGRELKKRGFVPHLIQTPEALCWDNGCAQLAADKSIRINGVIRFFQAEWLAKLPTRTGWRELFKGSGPTLVSNALKSVISESKRLPLSFASLKSPSSTWSELSPGCRDPREIDAQDREEWVLKATYSNTGDAVHVGAQIPRNHWAKLLSKAQKSPSHWVAQRRFQTLNLESVHGPLRPCVGIFVIGKKASGAYVRLSSTQVTDAYALEAPLFVTPEEAMP